MVGKGYGKMPERSCFSAWFIFCFYAGLRRMPERAKIRFYQYPYHFDINPQNLSASIGRWLEFGLWISKTPHPNRGRRLGTEATRSLGEAIQFRIARLGRAQRFCQILLLTSAYVNPVRFKGTSTKLGKVLVQYVSRTRTPYTTARLTY